MGFDRVVPTHQGRGAENVLFGALLDDGDVVLSIAISIGVTLGLIAGYARRRRTDHDTDGTFKGNFDIDAGYALVEEVGADAIPVVALTITNNSVAGQPVSMANIRATAEFARDIDAMFVIDACRFAENAHFIKTHEAGYENHSVAEIARAQFEHADAITMSGKKDALVNIGGFTAVRDAALFEQCKQRAILYEGFPTYGGLAGRDLDAMAPACGKRFDRCTSGANRTGQPIGLLYVETSRSHANRGHAVYIDAAVLFPDIRVDLFAGRDRLRPLPRGRRHGSRTRPFAFPGTNRPDLVRLALPRRTYSREHLEHVAETAARFGPAARIRRPRNRRGAADEGASAFLGAARTGCEGHRPWRS